MSSVMNTTLRDWLNKQTRTSNVPAKLSDARVAAKIARVLRKIPRAL